MRSNSLLLHVVIWVAIAAVAHAEDDKSEPMAGRSVISTELFTGEARITRVVERNDGAFDVFFEATIPDSKHEGEQKIVFRNAAYIRENQIRSGGTYRCNWKVTHFRVLTAKGLGEPKSSGQFEFPDFHERPEANTKVAAPFMPDWASLEKYTVPDWFRDAKFGIFVHWGPQTIAGESGSADGTKSPWKKLAEDFSGEKFDADHWADAFAKSGAKYVVQVAEHHDAYALYDSSLTQWSSVKMKPKRDFVAEFSAAARKKGLIFGASSHTEENWWFYSDPPKKAPPAPRPGRPVPPQPDKVFLDNWYARLVEINEKYRPQIFWFDWCIEQPAYEPYLKKFAAYYYNRAAEWKQSVVLNYKYDAFPLKAAVRDISWNTGRVFWKPGSICPTLWQFDTMSNRKYWFWRKDMEMRPASEIITELIDVASKNGNYLLNVPPAPDGTLTDGQEKILDALGKWFAVNGEAIYGTCPWKVYGEGPNEGLGSHFNNNPPKTPFISTDIRFTQSKDGATLYAIALGWPENGKLTIKSLGTYAKLAEREIKSIRLLGAKDALTFERNAESLTITLPGQRSGEHAFAFKIEWR